MYVVARSRTRWAALAVLWLSACGASGGGTEFNGGTFRQKPFKPYFAAGKMYVPHEDPDYDQIGTASWYGGSGALDDGFHGKRTAWGDVFDRKRMTAAHKTLPLPSFVEVTNLENGRRAVLMLNDRGPFVGDRIIDLSQGAAATLGYSGRGTARVRVRAVPPPENVNLITPDGRVIRGTSSVGYNAYADRR